MVVLRASTAEETEQIGERIARAWPHGPGEIRGSGATQGSSDSHGSGPAVVYLTGDLGAGKTTLTRGFLRALGAKGPVRSPTYTLVEVYDLGPITALHLDLYRLRDPSELDELGLREWAKADHVWLIEWPDRGAGKLPGPDLSLTLLAGEGAHEIQVQTGSALGQRWLAKLQLRSLAE